jgi:hypothetical protein
LVFQISKKEFLPQNLPQFFTGIKIQTTNQLWMAPLRGQRRPLASFARGGGWYGMVFQFDATLRPSMRVFKIHAWRWKYFREETHSKKYGKNS